MNMISWLPTIRWFDIGLILIFNITIDATIYSFSHWWSHLDASRILEIPRSFICLFFLSLLFLLFFRWWLPIGLLLLLYCPLLFCSLIILIRAIFSICVTAWTVTNQVQIGKRKRGEGEEIKRKESKPGQYWIPQVEEAPSYCMCCTYIPTAYRVHAAGYRGWYRSHVHSEAS